MQVLVDLDQEPYTQGSTHTYVHIRAFTQRSTHIHTHIHTYIHKSLYSKKHTHTYTHTYIHTGTWHRAILTKGPHSKKHTYIPTYTHTHTHTGTRHRATSTKGPHSKRQTPNFLFQERVTKGVCSSAAFPARLASRLLGDSLAGMYMCIYVCV